MTQPQVFGSDLTRISQFAGKARPMAVWTAMEESKNGRFRYVSRQLCKVPPRERATPKNRRILMKNFAKKVQRFLVSEDGPTAVEYAVMMALIVIVCLAAIRTIGTNANSAFLEVATQLGA